MKFNLNDYVAVQITEYGWKYLKEEVDEEYIKHCILPYKTVIDDEEWYKIQGHQMITLFGKSMFNASYSPLKQHIIF